MRSKPGVTAALILIFSVCASGKTKQPTPACKVAFSVVTEDQLGNLKQGLTDKQVGEIAKTLIKKYPGVCYVPPAPDVQLVFFISVSSATYHGSQTETHTSTQDVPEQGKIQDEYGEEVGTYSGTTTQTTTTHSTVPVQFDYPVGTLSIEQAQSDGTYKVLHRFQKDGLCTTYAGMCVNNRHPLESLIENGVKWMYYGGMNDPLQSVAGGGTRAGQQVNLQSGLPEPIAAQLPKTWLRLCSHDCEKAKPEYLSVWIDGGNLREQENTTAANIEIGLSCSNQRGEKEWDGSCTYTLTWPTSPGRVCTVQTSERVTTVSAEAIEGTSQEVDWTPLTETPSRCPVQGTGYDNFTYVPAR